VPDRGAAISNLNSAVPELLSGMESALNNPQVVDPV